MQDGSRSTGGLIPDTTLNPAALRGRERWLMVAVGLAILTGPWNFTMLIVALPNLAGDLDVSLVTASWVIIIPMIFASSIQTIAGRIGDMIGYRRVLIVGLAGYTVITIAAALAPGFWILVALRALQVSFGSASFPNGSALIRVNLPEARRATAYGVISAAISIAITGGPFVGGALADLFSWRAIFIANIPLSLLALFVMVRQVPRDREEDRRWPTSLDAPGVGLLMLSVAAIVLPMTLARDGFVSPTLLPVVYAGTLVLLLAFARWEYRHPDPIIQVRLYLSNTFRSTVVSEMFMNLAGFPLTIVASLYLQALQDRSAAESGLLIALGTIGMAAASPIGGRLADRFGRRRPIIGGRILMVVGLLILIGTASPDTSAWIIVIGMALVFSGNGLALPPSQTSAIESAPRRFSGMAAGVATTTSFMGGIVGITWSSIYLGESPSVDQFLVVFSVFAAAAVASILIATRIAHWPAAEQRASEATAAASD